MRFASRRDAFIFFSLCLCLVSAFAHIFALKCFYSCYYCSTSIQTFCWLLYFVESDYFGGNQPRQWCCIVVTTITTGVITRFTLHNTVHLHLIQFFFAFGEAGLRTMQALRMQFNGRWHTFKNYCLCLATDFFSRNYFSGAKEQNWPVNQAIGIYRTTTKNCKSSSNGVNYVQ